MAPLNPSAAPGNPQRCDHCGRAVRETEHTRTSYSVDYYSLHTGEGEPCVLATENGERRIVFLKLLSMLEIVTCADCYRDAAVQRARERLFRPERVAKQE